MIITICVSLFLSLLALHVFLRYNRAQRLIYKIPGPTPLPFLGNMLMFNGLTGAQFWNILYDLHSKYYPVLRLSKVTESYILIRHPEDVKIFTSSKENIQKAELGYGFFGILDTDGIFFSEGEKWQQRRKMLNPVFHPDLMKVYVEITNEHTKGLIKHMKNQNLEIIPDLPELMNKFAMDIIGEVTTCMGSRSSIFDSSEIEKFIHNFHEIGEVIFTRTRRPYIKDWMMRFLPMGRRAQRAITDIHEFVTKVIQERREYHKKIGYRHFQNGDNNDGFTGQRKRLAILDLLLGAEMDNIIDEKGIREEIETMVVAGYETTGVALSFALMLLAENPEAQDLARAEATEIINRTGGELTIADCNEMSYLDRCVKETLRLFPSGPYIGRKIKHEIKLSNYKIPCGTDVFLSIFALHRDPNFWPDSEKFDPDRFLPANVKERHPFAYAPFGSGPRVCIGFKLGMLEMKTLLSRILYNFYLEPVDLTAKVKFEFHVTLRPRDPCRIKLLRINRESTT